MLLVELCCSASTAMFQPMEKKKKMQKESNKEVREREGGTKRADECKTKG